MDKTPAILTGEFFSKYTKLRYKKGEVVLRAGDPPPGVLYLERGYVRQSFVAPNGDMLVLHVFKPGSFFPMTWIVNDTANRYYFEALTQAEIWRAPREDFRRFLSDKPAVRDDFLSRILSGVSGIMRRMEELVLESAYRKTVSLLLYYAKRFPDEQTKGRLVVPLTHKEVAAWIGTTRETASLQIEELKRKKLIHYDKRYIVIPDVAALTKEAQASEGLE